MPGLPLLWRGARRAGWFALAIEAKILFLPTLREKKIAAESAAEGNAQQIIICNPVIFSNHLLVKATSAPMGFSVISGFNPML